MRGLVAVIALVAVAVPAAARAAQPAATIAGGHHCANHRVPAPRHADALAVDLVVTYARCSSARRLAEAASRLGGRSFHLELGQADWICGGKHTSGAAVGTFWRCHSGGRRARFIVEPDAR